MAESRATSSDGGVKSTSAAIATATATPPGTRKVQSSSSSESEASSSPPAGTKATTSSYLVSSYFIAGAIAGAASRTSVAPLERYEFSLRCSTISLLTCFYCNSRLLLHIARPPGLLEIAMIERHPSYGLFNPLLQTHYALKQTEDHLSMSRQITCLWRCHFGPCQDMEGRGHQRNV